MVLFGTYQYHIGDMVVPYQMYSYHRKADWVKNTYILILYDILTHIKSNTLPSLFQKRKVTVGSIGHWMSFFVTPTLASYLWLFIDHDQLEIQYSHQYLDSYCPPFIGLIRKKSHAPVIGLSKRYFDCLENVVNFHRGIFVELEIGNKFEN